jgi:RimJ/RimL family protein N-acetyltransferase
MESAHEGTISEADLDRIAAVCSQPRIYEMLFRDLFGGRGYARKDAEAFRGMCYTGWGKRASYVFLLRDSPGRIVGVLDIKSNKPDGPEIGYWASADSPGYMTNAVAAMAELAKSAGYRSLTAMVRVANEKSQRLLERVGFARKERVVEDGVAFWRYGRAL